MEIVKAETSRIEGVDFDDLGFGRHFSDHMFSMRYEGDGWAQQRIMPFQEICFNPSMSVLHYGQAVFEGMKAFHAQDGSVHVFRPRNHHARMNRSSNRLCVPETDFEKFIEALEALIKVDREWIPTKKGRSLYIRPFVFATDDYLGVRVSRNYRYLIITSPVAAYYKEGLNPVKLKTSLEHIRAAEGGLGEAKTPANYAAALLAANRAKAQGFSEVLWLDSKERRYVEEVGAMNIFFLLEDELVTAPLRGTILPGVTRASVIRIAKDWGYTVNERPITIDEVIRTSKDGTMKEVFGTGTAAVISPVGRISHGEDDVVINDGEIGEFSQRMYDEITGIQYGEKEDRYGWCHVIE